MLDVLPYDIIYNVFKYADLPTLSNLLCSNKRLHGFLNDRKWEIIDNMIDIGVCIPNNVETYNEYIYCVDFTTLVYNKHKLSDSVIINLHKYIDFEMLSRNQKLSYNILYKFYHKISLSNLISQQTLPPDLLLKIVKTNTLNSAEWHWVCKNQKFDIEFINTYINHIDWHALSQNINTVSLDILQKYTDKIIWSEITNNGVSEEILNACIHKLDSFSWSNISYSSKLSSQFILKYKPHLNIFALLSCQNLEENIIVELINSDKFYPKNDLWNKVASCQKLSKQFIIQNIENLQLRFMIRNKKIKRGVLKDIYG